MLPVVRSRRLLTLAGAIALWRLLDLPIAAPLVFTFLATYLLSVFVLRSERFTLPTRYALPALIAVAVVAIAPRLDALRDTEQLTGLDVVLRDRWRIQDTPAVAPAVLHLDRPSLLYGHAPGAERFDLVFEDSRVAGEDLGHGLFAFAFEPREHTVGEVRYDVDGEVGAADLRVSRPRHEPKWGCVGDGLAVPSEPTDTLFVFDGSTWREEQTLDGPTDCVGLEDGRRVVAHRYSDALSIGAERVRVGFGQARLARRGSTIAVAIAEPPSVVFVEAGAAEGTGTSTRSGTGAADSTSTGTVAATASRVVHRVALDTPPDWIAYAGDTLLVTSRRAHTLARLGHDDPLDFGRPAITLAVAPSGRYAFVTLTDYRPEGDAGPNHHVEEQIAVVDVEAWRVVQRIRTGALGALPSGIFARDDATLDVVFAGTDTLATFDVDLARGAVVDGEADRRVALPIAAPHGVLRFGGATFVSSPADGAFHRVESNETKAFAEPDDVRRGYRAFYEATRAGVACATCHLHAGSDFAPHDIGHDTPRPTLDVRGVWGTAPYLRGASYPTIGALHGFAEAVLDGYARPVEDRPALLEAFLASRGLERPRPSFPSREGVAAFVRADCVHCHAFPAFTNLAQIPEPALFPERRGLHALDTPSLFGVRDAPPYLFDGRAETLRAVLFEHDRAGRHGAVARLDEDEREALLALLEAL